MNRYNKIFFTNVLRLCVENGLSKHTLASRAGMSVSFLSDLTNGKANPSLKIMAAIADALGLALPSLLAISAHEQDATTIGAPRELMEPIPTGLVHVTANLTEYQAFRVRQWDDANKHATRRHQLCIESES